jgi:cytochrome P450
MILPQPQPKGPKSVLPFGTEYLIRIGIDPISFLEDLGNYGEDIVHYVVGKTHFYLLTNPDFIKKLLVTNQRKFIKGHLMSSFAPLAGNGLLMSESPDHITQRRLLQPTFARQSIIKYAPTIVDCATAVTTAWRNQADKKIDITAAMTALAMSIITRTMFNSELDATKDSELSRELLILNDWFKRLMVPYFGVFLDKLPLPSTKRYKAAIKYFESAIYTMIADRRAVGTNSNDLLSTLISMQDDGQKQLSSDFIRDQLVAFILAGHETTAVTMNWLWYLLSQHPEVEAKLHAELDSVLGGRLPTAADLGDLKYTEMVILETLRVRSPVFIFFRESIEVCEFGDYQIPAGSVVLVSPHLMHRNSNYFPDPEKFEPERWTTEFKAHLPRFAYFPFGGGPRQCIGESFALMEIVLCVATIAQKWQIRITDQEDSAKFNPKVVLKSKRNFSAVITDYQNAAGSDSSLIAIS